MKVKCLYNTNENFFVKIGKYDFFQNYENALKITKEYIVYSISYYEDHVNYLIFDEYKRPFWYCDKLFIILDSKLSAYWYYKNYENKNYPLKMILGYFELINEEEHYDDLLKENKDCNEEKEKEALEIFYKRKKEMDMEFPDFSVKEKANTIDQNWFICPKCMDAWESNSIFGMVECPKCNTIMHNPRYKKN
jgi:hypothetical protein